MPKRLNVELGFTADTSQAKQQIADLQKSLNNLLSSAVKNNAFSGFNKDISTAQQSVLKLKDAINNSLNADTGRLDLSKFNTQLNTSGLSMDKLASDMSAMGVDGQKAFLNLANSIVTAQKPMAETNKLLDGMWTALKNTARWQLSSSMLHGFMSAISGAYGYAQDLNESLNNIRIVTGLSADEMAVFADQANKSAQALSASTLAYTDAALIYYQQGIRDQDEINSRVETTIKLSNVTGQSAEQVSSYMTAIWNNFYDGSQSLESYADKITALGAATASSSEEIAKGLQQFASLGSSLGLNYDDAVAALATVVAQTRQSASTVGNSFRTLLQRFESLKLGDTLEDGVDLTKYSAALQKVGVQVLDVNGEMRNMSDVIQDLGEKWQTLSDAQRNALAQTVGGVRNANTMIAWMDNFDKFQDNLMIAQDAEGTLQDQADIYAESWEAAQKRVKAAWQAIYQDLIDDDFFITILNGVEKLLQGVDKLIDSLGGIPGVLAAIGTVASTLFEKQMIAGVQKMQQQLKNFIKVDGKSIAEREADDLADKTVAALDKLKSDKREDLAQNTIIENQQEQVRLYREINRIKDTLNESDINYYNTLVKQTEELAKQEALLINQKKEAVDKLDNAKRELAAKNIEATVNGNISEDDNNYKEWQNILSGNDENFKGKISKIAKLEGDALNKEIQALTKEYYEKGEALNYTAKEVMNLVSAEVENEKIAQRLEAVGLKRTQAEKAAKIAITEHKTEIEAMETVLKEEGAAIEEEIRKLEEENSQLEESGSQHEDNSQTIEDNKEKIQALNKELEKNNELLAENTKKKQDNSQSQGETGEPKSLGDKLLSSGAATNITKGFQAVSQMTMAVNALGAAWKTVQDPNLEPWEKFSSVAMSLGMAIPGFINGVKNLGSALGIGAVAAFQLVLAIGAIIAIVKIFDALIYTTAERLADANKNLEASQQALQKAEDAAQKAGDAYKKLGETLDSLYDKREAINQLTKGTTEWKEAIANSNAELLSALEAAGQLDNAKLSWGEGGLISVQNAGELKENARQQSLDADMGAMLARIAVNENKKDVALIESLDAVREASQAQTEAIHLETGNTADVSDYNKVISEAAAEFVGKTDEETMKVVSDYAQQLVESGFAGQQLTQELISKNGEQLGFLSEISDNQELLDAIQAAADQISQADKSSDAYKKEVGRLAAEKAGYDTSGMTGSALESFYLDLYNDLESKVNDKWAQMSEKEQLKAFAEGSNGQYKWDGEQLIDVSTSKIVQTSEIAQSQIEELGKSALIQQEANNLTADNLKQMSQQSLAQMRTDAREKFDANFGEGSSQAMNGMSDKEFQFALDADLSSFREAKEAIEYIKEACKEPHEVPLKISDEGLTQFKGKQEELNAEIEEFSEFLKKNYEDYEGLSEHIAECDAAADAAAASFIRFDDAIQDISKNYKTWKKALDSKDVKQTNDAVKQLRKTYANLLDLDGSQLSENFLKSSENLDLLNTVMEGTEEEAIAAYEQLQKIQTIEFAKDIAPNIDVDAFSAAYDEVAYWTDLMQLKMGDDINMGDLHYDNLVNSLNAVLGSMSMTKEQADEIMRSMNYSGELQLMPVNTTDTDTKEDAIANVEEEPVPAQGVHLETSDTDYTPSLKEAVSGTVSSVTWSKGGLTSAVKNIANTVQSMRWQVADGSTLHYLGGAAPKVSNMPSRNYNNGGGGGGGGCFAAGTPITLNNYYKNIEDIKVGDVVLSYNEKTKKNEYSKVVQTMIHNVYEKIYDLFIKNDKLIVTGNHRFLITRNNEQKWIQAADIQLGDYVLLADGTLYKISKINIQTKFLTVYNFEVSNTHNYYVGENQVLAHNKGGGGGKAKKKKVEKKKDPTKNIKEADRYHNIKEKIEDLNTEMKRLNENKDRAYGKDRIKWMDEEIKKTEEQIKLTDEYIKEIKDYAKIDKEDLKTKLGSFISDADFDENGVLKDYEGLLAKIQSAFDDNVTAALNKATEEYNKAVDAFNESDQEDEATEEFDKAKEAWDKAKETYDKEKETYEERLDALKQYEDTINLLQEKEQERIDQLNELYDKWLAMTEYKVEISLDVNESDRQLLDWIYNHLGDKADKAADRIANLGQQLKTSQKDIATYVKGIEELFAQNGMNVNLDANNLDGVALGEQLDKMIEKLRADGSEPNIQKVIDDMKEYRDGLMDTYDTMRDVVDEVTENVVNAYDEWNEKLQENLDLMDHYDTVIDTIKEIADLLGEDQLGLGDAQAEAYEASKLKNQQNAAAIAKDNYDAIAAERQKAQEMLDKAESETEKRHWEEVLKNLEESEKEAMEEYLARWRDALRQAEENYQASLERNEKAYQKTMSGGLGTLDRLQEQLDREKELDNLYLEEYEKYKKLGDLSAKINKNLANNPNVKVQEKMKDLLDDVNAKMEAGAEISEGEATILEKRLALLEAENQLQEARNAKSAVRMTRDNEGNFSYTYTADTSKIEEAQQNYADKFYDLLDYERQYSDETQANMLQSWQDFIDKRNDILDDDMLSEEERNKALEKLKGDYDELVSYYADELGMVMDEMGRLKTEDWKDMEAILGRLLAAPEDFQTNYQDTVLGKITNAWQNPEDLKDSWVGAVNSLYEADTAARNKWIASNEETNRRVDTSTREFADNYVGTLGEVVEASNEVAKSAEEMAQSMGPAMDKVLGEAKDFFSEIGLYMDNLVENIKSIVSAINDLQGVLAGIDPEWQSKILGKLPEGSEKSNMAGYDTGGYTGEWGSSGKLAVLHQKELVLNAFDTSNILKAVDLIRNIPSFGTNVNINHNIDYGSLAAVGATDLQQQVHIDASFPNVQSHTEIELALNNLINSASQYVNRKS